MFLADITLDRTQIQQLAKQVRSSIDVTKTHIVVSNSSYIRSTLTTFLAPYNVAGTPTLDTLDALESSIVDFVIVSRSKKIYTFSEYNTKLKKISCNESTCCNVVEPSSAINVVILSQIVYITTTFAGVYPEADFTDGTTDTASFSYPSAVGTDSDGNVYVADTMNNNIREVDLSGNVSTLSGSLNQGPGNLDGFGNSAFFYGPTGLTVDANKNIYVVDAINSTIRKIDSDGNVTTLAGNGVYGFSDGIGNRAIFNFLYGPKPVFKYEVTTLAGMYLEEEFMNGPLRAASFAYPTSSATDSYRNVYVADTMNNSIREITTYGEVITFAGSSNQASGRTDGTNALFFGPTGITLDANNNIYVVDAINGLIRKITPGGMVTTLAGSTAGFNDGSGSTVQFKFVYATNP
jgi:hypothetical protein